MDGHLLKVHFIFWTTRFRIVRPGFSAGKPAPPGVEPEIPFRVVRSRYGNLPVYLDYKSGGSQVLTIVRKVEGEAEVRETRERERERDG